MTPGPGSGKVVRNTTRLPLALLAAALAIRVADAASRARPNDEPPITALRLLPNQHGVVATSQAGVVTVQDESRQPLVDCDLENIHDLAIAPGGDRLAIAGGSPGESGAIELWSMPGHRRIRVLDGHDDVVYAAAWLNATTLVSAGADRAIYLWDTVTGDRRASLAGHSAPVLCLAISPDAKLICSGSADQTIRIWNAESHELVRTLTNHLGPVHDLMFVKRPGPPHAPVHYLVSAGGDRTIRFWQAETGRMVRFTKHPAPVLSLAWDGGARLVSGGKDGWVRVMDIETSATVQEDRVSSSWVTALAISASSGRIYVGDSSGAVRVHRLP